MKIGTMLRDVFESFFKKPATQIYPLEKVITSDRFRGKLVYDPTACTGCCLCTKDCPSNAIELITIDRAAKRFVLKYHMDRCIYCGQCVQNCKFKCMSMDSQDWELAALKKEEFEVYYGNENEVASFLEKLAHPVPVPPAKPDKG
jgi:formate hydrogenlyase subunit 6/NADH:ubiquinone oxidoreductase subunit I